MTRPHPFAIVFGTIAEQRFPALRDACGPAPSIDEFLLAQPAIELLRELRPDEGLGDAIDDFIAFVHASFCYWAAGSRTAGFDEATTRWLCGTRDAAGSGGEGAMYIQVAPRIIWAQLAADTSYEPLDGWFVIPEGAALRVVACFGVHPARPGLSVLALVGPPPEGLTRSDGTPLFSPTMPGGDAAGLYALAGPEEMLLLAWRAREITEVR